MMKNSLIATSLLILAGSTASPVWSATADEILSKASADARSAKGITCTFTVKTGAKSFAGELKSAGSKFCVVTPAGSSWYNGKAMYSHNPTTSETTIYTPTAGELAEVNPLLYLTTAPGSYTTTMSARQPKTGYSLTLTPRSRKMGIKKVIVQLTAQYRPECISITGPDGSVTDIVVKSLSYNATLPSSAFEYPKSRYTKAQIVDLR